MIRSLKMYEYSPGFMWLFIGKVRIGANAIIKTITVSEFNDIMVYYIKAKYGKIVFESNWSNFELIENWIDRIVGRNTREIVSDGNVWSVLRIPDWPRECARTSEIG